MSCGAKCMRPGPITSNGYLNFLRVYRKKHCGLTAKETVRRGARAWNRLTCEQKQRYRRLGTKQRSRRRSRGRTKRSSRCAKRRRKRRSSRRCGRKRRRRRSRCARKRRRSSSRRRSRSRSSSKKCMRPGRITNNGYLNFLRCYRKYNCGMSPQETIRRGARKWCSLSRQDKEKFRKMGRQRSRRRRRSAGCKRRRRSAGRKRRRRSACRRRTRRC